MNTKELLLTTGELDLLASAIGCAWDHYGAQAALEDGKYALLDMYVQTESGAVTIASRLQAMDFEGSADEYARVEVRPGAEGSGIAHRRGSIFFQERGRTVTGVLVVRDSVRSSGQGTPGFAFVADVGIVFVLDEGVIAVCLGGPFASDLIMTRASSLQALEVADTSADWGEDILNQLDFEREFVPLTNLGSE